VKKKYDELSDQELLELWREGDKEASSTLFKRHYGALARFFAYKLGPGHNDLVQDTFEGLLEGIERLRGTSNFKAFLFGIARNKLLKHLRTMCRERARFDPATTSIVAVEPNPSPRSVLVADERQRLLLAALRRLPVDTQIMIELHYWEAMKIREIALAFDMPQNTVKARMRRGRIKLEQIMTELAESPGQLETSMSGLEGWARRLREDLGEGEEGDEEG
jgi:RNA polymerase sigma-70 factor (ECF subfamily)